MIVPARSTRRVVLLLAVMGVAILLAGGAALADIIDGTNNDETIRDYILDAR